MSTHRRSVMAGMLLVLSILACGISPTGGGETQAPTGSSSDQVATIVASTLEALTPPPSSSEIPEPVPVGLLPHPLHFINNDSAGIAQVFRIETDGKTLSQITFEPQAVSSYDVSKVDGSVVYVSNNQLLLVKADGSGRRVLLDGGTIDQNNPFMNTIRFPVFSNNGQTIAYGYKGLNLYAVGTGVSNRVLEDNLDDLGGGLIVPREMFWPDKFSPDGTKLLITLGYYEGASSAVYYPAPNSLVRLSNDEGALICCGDPKWTPDSSGFVVGNPIIGMFNAGLWRVDASSGKVSTLLTSNLDNGTLNLVDEPYLAPDNRLYYFYATQEGTPETSYRPPLQLVRSAADGVGDRTVLIPDSFLLLNEALWAPDASFVVVAAAPIADVHQGGSIELYYTDGQRKMVSLAPYGQQFKWGP